MPQMVKFPYYAANLSCVLMRSMEKRHHWLQRKRPKAELDNILNLLTSMKLNIKARCKLGNHRCRPDHSRKQNKKCSKDISEPSFQLEQSVERKTTKNSLQIYTLNVNVLVQINRDARPRGLASASRPLEASRGQNFVASAARVLASTSASRV